jgi:hypothetical protein
MNIWAVQEKRERKIIPKDGIFLSYIVYPENGKWRRKEAQDFDYNAGELIDTIDSIDVPGFSCKVYIDGKKVFDGEASEVKKLPQVLSYLPAGWKSKKQQLQPSDNLNPDDAVK